MISKTSLSRITIVDLFQHCTNPLEPHLVYAYTFSKKETFGLCIPIFLVVLSVIRQSVYNLGICNVSVSTQFILGKILADLIIPLLLLNTAIIKLGSNHPGALWIDSPLDRSALVGMQLT